MQCNSQQTTDIHFRSGSPNEKQITFRKQLRAKKRNNTEFEAEVHKTKNFDVFSNRDEKSVQKLKEKQIKAYEYWRQLQVKMQDSQDNQKNREKTDQTYTLIELGVDKHKNPGKYAVGQEIGMTDQQVYKSKPDDINFQLQKYTRNKGIEYLKKSCSQSRVASHKILPTVQKQTLQLPSIAKAQHIEDKKHQNPTTNKKPKRKSITKSEKKLLINQNLKNHIRNQETKQSIKHKKKQQTENPELIPKKSPIYKYKHKSKKKRSITEHSRFTKLYDMEETLGKYVYLRVKQYFQLSENKGAKYLEQVKSEQNIDNALVKYLKTKIHRADLAISHC